VKDGLTFRFTASPLDHELRVPFSHFQRYSKPFYCGPFHVSVDSFLLVDLVGGFSFPQSFSLSFPPIFFFQLLLVSLPL